MYDTIKTSLKTGSVKMRHAARKMSGSRSIWARGSLGLAVAIMAVGFIAPSADAVPRKVKRACKGDYKSLCPRYRVGTSRMRSCMRSKGRQLSWDCYQALKDAGYVRRGRRRR